MRRSLRRSLRPSRNCTYPAPTFIPRDGSSLADHAVSQTQSGPVGQAQSGHRDIHSGTKLYAYCTTTSSSRHQVGTQHVTWPCLPPSRCCPVAAQDRSADCGGVFDRLSRFSSGGGGGICTNVIAENCRQPLFSSFLPSSLPSPGLELAVTRPAQTHHVTPVLDQLLPTLIHPSANLRTQRTGNMEHLAAHRLAVAREVLNRDAAISYYLTHSRQAWTGPTSSAAGAPRARPPRAPWPAGPS